MTDLTTDRPPYVPTVRPVRRFVIWQVVVAVVFGALWFSGLVAPRLGLGNKAGGMYDTISRRGTVHVELRDKSLLAVDVRGVTLAGGRVNVTSVRINGVDTASGGRRVAGRGMATMDVDYTCPAPVGGPRLPLRQGASAKVEVTVRTPLGIERTLPAGTTSVLTACLG